MGLIKNLVKHEVNTAKTAIKVGKGVVKLTQSIKEATNTTKEIDDETFAQLEQIELNTPENLYEYCSKSGLGMGTTKAWSIENFKVIIDHLSKNEKVLVPFTGLHNYENTTTHDGTYAYVITNQRVIWGKKVMFGDGVDSVYLGDITDVNYKIDGLAVNAKLTIRTLNRTYMLGVARGNIEQIHGLLNDVLSTYKESKGDVLNFGSPESNKMDGYEEVKKAKELLDMGIITRDEFEKKKKELLNL